MPTSLQDASVVVIGGTSGIGLATAQMAHDAGARVVIAGRDPERLAAAPEQLGGEAGGVNLDIADDEEAVVARCAPLDHVAPVASFAGTHVHGMLADVESAALQGPVDNRLWGTVYMYQYAAPLMTDGSITICTGVGVARPRAGAAI